MKTKDGIPVQVGDIVFVIGSCSIEEAKVLEPVTNYEYFGPIPVRESFSSREAAEGELK